MTVADGDSAIKHYDKCVLFHKDENVTAEDIHARCNYKLTYRSGLTLSAASNICTVGKYDLSQRDNYNVPSQLAMHDLM